MNSICLEVEDWERQALESLQGGTGLNLGHPPDTENTRNYADADVEMVCPFVSDWSADVLQHLSRLRVIATRSTGLYRP